MKNNEVSAEFWGTVHNTLSGNGTAADNLELLEVELTDLKDKHLVIQPALRGRPVSPDRFPRPNRELAARAHRMVQSHQNASLTNLEGAQFVDLKNYLTWITLSNGCTIYLGLLAISAC